MLNLVSDGEIRRAIREIGVQLPRANALLRSFDGGKLSLRDAVYFTLLESLERRRHAELHAGAASQSVPPFGD